MKIPRPLNDTFIVKPDARDLKTQSGLYIPEAAQQKPTQGKVVAVGEGRKFSNGYTHVPDVKVGETVMYGQWEGKSFKHEGVEYLLMTEQDIFIVIEE